MPASITQAHRTHSLRQSCSGQVSECVQGHPTTQHQSILTLKDSSDNKVPYLKLGMLHQQGTRCSNPAPAILVRASSKLVARVPRSRCICSYMALAFIMELKRGSQPSVDLRPHILCKVLCTSVGRSWTPNTLRIGVQATKS